MNLANKLSVTRIFLTIIILLVISFPFNEIGINTKEILVMGKILVDVKFLIAGFLYVIEIVLYYLGNSISRRNYELKTRSLSNFATSLLILITITTLSFYGFINVIVPIILITREILIMTLRPLYLDKREKLLPNKLDKLSILLIFLGSALMLFYNLPFEAFGIYVADLLIDIGVVTYLISAISHYFKYRKLD